MRLGVVFPQTEIHDPEDIVRFASAVEQLGYEHIVAFDHVVGVDTSNRPDWDGAYSSEDRFHEPLVLFGFLAGLTSSLRLVSGTIILPQRQAVLVAKQAAEVDLLSSGRLTLGIGIGWNRAEYEALSESFSDRGRRVEEQIDVMRCLWTSKTVSMQGNWHSLSEVSINPLPCQQPIPIWIGGNADAVLERVGRMADGWMPLQRRPDAGARRASERVRHYLSREGRAVDGFPVNARLTLRSVPQHAWRDEVDAWRNLGVTHLSVNTMGMGLAVSQQISMLQSFRASMRQSTTEG